MRDTYSVEDAIVVVVVETGFPPDVIEEYTWGPESPEELELVLEVEREVEREVEVEVEPEDAVYFFLKEEGSTEDVVSLGEGAGVSLGAT